MRALALGAMAGLAIGAAPRPTGRRLARRWPAPTIGPRQRRHAAISALALVGLVAPPLAVILPLALWTRRRIGALRADRALAKLVRDALPDLVDLLALSCSAGLSLPVAHPLVAVHIPAPIGHALVAAHEAAAAGRPRADALLAELAPFGDRARALADVLVDHLRYGVPLMPGLERAGLELRLDRRRRAELEARRVPVRLLAPLVTCVLPAFALLTVVPLLAASLDALPT